MAACRPAGSPGRPRHASHRDLAPDPSPDHDPVPRHAPAAPRRARAYGSPSGHRCGIPAAHSRRLPGPHPTARPRGPRRPHQRSSRRRLTAQQPDSRHLPHRHPTAHRPGSRHLRRRSYHRWYPLQGGDHRGPHQRRIHEHRQAPPPPGWVSPRLRVPEQAHRLKLDPRLPHHGCSHPRLRVRLAPGLHRGPLVRSSLRGRPAPAHPQRSPAAAPPGPRPRGTGALSRRRPSGRQLG